MDDGGLAARLRAPQGMSMSAIKLMVRGAEGTRVTLTLARSRAPRVSSPMPMPPASIPGTMGMYDVSITRTVAPLDDAQMAVFADVSEALSCLDLRDDVSLDLLRQRHASSHAAATHRAFCNLMAVLGRHPSPISYPASALLDDSPASWLLLQMP